MPELLESVARRYALVEPHLTEVQRRLWLGAEAAELGSGGVALVAKAVGVSPDTVRRGRKEVSAGLDVDAGEGRSRRPGGGRKRAEDHDATLLADFDALIEPVTRGDPMSPLRWTNRSIRSLTAALQGQGHKVSDMVTRRLLKENGFSLQANAKTIEGNQHEDRDAQFLYLNDKAAEYLSTGQAVISIDTKKKELVGQYKNNGREWNPQGEPDQVKVHDFVDPTLGKANPYGVYDVGTNTGWVSVGTDHDTAAFAVNTIRSWWINAGQQLHPGATRLLISADGGGSNGYRLRLFKTELAKFAAETGLEVTVCHLPPGTSKWNKIEHRLFAHISINWRGRPLTSHQVIVDTIAATTTDTGLTVQAELDETIYPTGVFIDPKIITQLEDDGILIRHDFHGEWNYTVRPPNRDDTPETT